MTPDVDMPSGDTVRTVNILFLCTGNSARSILGEALVTHIGATMGGIARGFSAGSMPVGAVHPLALETLQQRGLETGGLRSKSWQEFAAPDAPKMDVILTVCDNAASEPCPVWPGHPVTAHWGLPDPAGQDEDPVVFEAIFHILKDRLEQFFGSDIANQTPDEWKGLLARLGGNPGM